MIGAVLIATLLWMRYQRSTIGKLRRQIEAAFVEASELLDEMKALAAKGLADVQESAEKYTEAIHKGFLQGIPLEALKRFAPGARLQPLRERGITNALMCQGWDANRLIQLRGIGPDSASRIAFAIQAVTKAINEQPVPHPKTNDSGLAPALFWRLFIYRQLQFKLTNATTQLEAVFEDFRTHFLHFRHQASFLAWLFGHEAKGKLRAAIDAGRAIVVQLGPTESWGGAIGASHTRFAEAVQVTRNPASQSLWTNDVSANGDYYKEAFENLLGKEPTDSSPMRAVLQAPASPVTYEPVTVRHEGTPSRGYAIDVNPGGNGEEVIPAAKATNSSDCWVPAGHSAKVGETQIQGGMLYIGKNLPRVAGAIAEPALINPASPVAHQAADCHVRMLPYWSSYSGASPEARASYLQWLVTGRTDPEADVGYVFLYFYGLERRALFDAKIDPLAREELPAIEEEVRRLQKIYGASRSFLRYSGEMLEFLSALRVSQEGSRGTATPPPLQQYHLSFALRFGLGRFASAGKPLPADWAYTWYYNDPRTRLPTAALRCPDQCRELFQKEYFRLYGDGLALPTNKTRIKLTYRPASASFGGSIAQSFDLPDVAILTGAYAKLEPIAVSCYSQLDGYSRLLARGKGALETLEALATLPIALWPETKRDALEGLRPPPGLIQTSTLKELLIRLGFTEAPTRAVYNSICRVFGSAGLGIEPDPRFGMEPPSPTDPIAVWAGPIAEKFAEGFGLAALLLRLASIVAASDGDFSEPEAEALKAELDRNDALGAPERIRLRARMATYRIKAPLLTGTKTSISSLSPEQRGGITDFLVTIVLADGTIAPGEVKVMEKIYGLFGLDAKLLYTRLHELSAGVAIESKVPLPAAGTGIQFSPERLRKLREDSEAATKKLTAIFDAEIEKETAPLVAPTGASPQPEEKPGLVGLDSNHSKLLAILLTRSQWTREEFEELCKDKELLPDGAIETINEATYTQFEQAIIEGEDPLEILTQLLEETHHAGTD
ncbi:MAG TPA: TerB N-terminal domain-containing protein [Candidatus Didemnitutus sp.]|nr:TerB N-terminal domain-containing protein [Candidatus Didemnitutus sp.]